MDTERLRSHEMRSSVDSPSVVQRISRRAAGRLTLGALSGLGLIADAADARKRRKKNKKSAGCTRFACFVRQWGGQGTGEGEFAEPKGIAVASNGDVYVADSGNHRMQQFAANGEFLRMWGDLGTEPGSFIGPNSVAVAPADGNVYVSEDATQRVQWFSATGEPRGVIEGGSHFLTATAVAVGTNGVVYIGAVVSQNPRPG